MRSGPRSRPARLSRRRGHPDPGDASLPRATTAGSRRCARGHFFSEAGVRSGAHHANDGTAASKPVRHHDAVEEAIFPAAVFNSFARSTRLIYDMDSSLSDQLTDKWRVLKPLRKLFETLERSVVRRSDATLAVCEELAAKVRPWTEADRVTVLPDVPDCGESTGAQVESLARQGRPALGAGPVCRQSRALSGCRPADRSAPQGTG